MKWYPYFVKKARIYFMLKLLVKTLTGHLNVIRKLVTLIIINNKILQMFCHVGLLPLLYNIMLTGFNTIGQV